MKGQLAASEARCSDLLVGKADLSELNSQLTCKNSNLSAEIDQLKVIPCFLVLCCYVVYK